MCPSWTVCSCIEEVVVEPVPTSKLGTGSTSNEASWKPRSQSLSLTASRSDQRVCPTLRAPVLTLLEPCSAHTAHARWRFLHDGTWHFGAWWLQTPASLAGRSQPGEPHRVPPPCDLHRPTLCASRTHPGVLHTARLAAATIAARSASTAAAASAAIIKRHWLVIAGAVL